MMETNKAIITMVGKDQIGIMAGVCQYLAQAQINILDIAQTILQDLFNMTMIVDLDTTDVPFDKIVEDLRNIGDQLHVRIRIQHESIFTSMHRI